MLQPTTNFSLPQKQYHPIISFTFPLASNLCIYLYSIPLLLSFTQEKSHLHLSDFKITKIFTKVCGFFRFVCLCSSFTHTNRKAKTFLPLNLFFLSWPSLFLSFNLFTHSHSFTNRTRQIFPAAYQFQVKFFLHHIKFE